MSFHFAHPFPPFHLSTPAPASFPQTSQPPRLPHAIPVFSLHASAHRLRTDIGIPTLSTSPHPTARGDLLFALSNHYLVFFGLCLGSSLKKLGFAKIKNPPPTGTLFYLNPDRITFHISSPIFPHAPNHFSPRLKTRCVFSRARACTRESTL